MPTLRTSSDTLLIELKLLLLVIFESFVQALAFLGKSRGLRIADLLARTTIIIVRRIGAAF